MIAEPKLLEMVRGVSQDQLHNTIEFNEFLLMMSKQQKESVMEEELRDAFRFSTFLFVLACFGFIKYALFMFGLF